MQSKEKERVERKPRVALRVLFFAVSLLVAFVLIEGLASVALFAYEIVFRPNPGLASRAHVDHDEQLGWLNRPDFFAEEMYGPGKDFHTNAQSFRNREIFKEQLPPGRLRLLCSGDSYTLGVGVGDEQTWCHRLGELEPRLQTVNLGEAGYGIGQAYLKYLRYGSKLDHDFQIFAFVSDDFRRLGRTEFVAWGKPRVVLLDGQLTVENVPVPRRAFYKPWLVYNSPKIEQLRSVAFGRRLLSLLPRGESVDPWRRTDFRETALAVFERIDQLNREKNSRAIFVYLPEHAIGAESREAERIAFLERELTRRGIVFIDLVGAFAELPYAELAPMFDSRWGHFSSAGNEFVAQRLHERLAGLPQRIATD